MKLYDSCVNKLQTFEVKFTRKVYFRCYKVAKNRTEDNLGF